MNLITIAWSRKIAAYALVDNIEAAQMKQAFKMPLKNRKPTDFFWFTSSIEDCGIAKRNMFALQMTIMFSWARSKLGPLWKSVSRKDELNAEKRVWAGKQITIQTMCKIIGHGNGRSIWQLQTSLFFTSANTAKRVLPKIPVAKTTGTIKKFVNLFLRRFRIIICLWSGIPEDSHVHTCFLF